MTRQPFTDLLPPAKAAGEAAAANPNEAAPHAGEPIRGGTPVPDVPWFLQGSYRGKGLGK